MLTIEDCLEKLDELQWEDLTVSGKPVLIGDSWDREFINNVCEHTRMGKALSTEQAKIATKIVNRYQWQLEALGCHMISIEDLLKSPQYRKALYESTIVPREVRWLGDSKLAFRCKYNTSIVNDIKKCRGVNHFASENFPHFNRDSKLWIIDVNSENLEKVMEVIKRYRFQFDSDVETFFLEAANSMGQRSEYTVDGDNLVINVRDDDLLCGWLNGIITMDLCDV